MKNNQESKQPDSRTFDTHNGAEYSEEELKKGLSQDNLFDETEESQLTFDELIFEEDEDDGESLWAEASRNYDANHADFIDEFGVRYNYWRDTLIKAPQSLRGNYKIASGTKVIRDGAFFLCRDLEHIELPHSISIIEKNAFYQCEKLDRIVLPENISKIGDYAFYDCQFLKEVCFDGSPNDLGNGIFKNCKKLKDVYLPSGMTRIGNGMFANCTSIVTVNLPVTITELEAGAFDSCIGLKEIILPESLEKIGGAAFMNCKNLNAIRIPASVLSIGSGAFAQTVCKIEIEGNRFSFVDRFLKQDSKLIACLSNNETVIVPDNIDTIASGCFCKDDDLRTVILPMSVMKVESDAFLECRFLEEITIKNPNIRLRADIIKFCPSLKKINLPSNASLPLKNLIRRLF